MRLCVDVGTGKGRDGCGTGRGGEGVVGREGGVCRRTKRGSDTDGNQDAIRILEGKTTVGHGSRRGRSG